MLKGLLKFIVFDWEYTLNRAMRSAEVHKIWKRTITEKLKMKFDCSLWTNYWDISGKMLEKYSNQKLLA